MRTVIKNMSKTTPIEVTLGQTEPGAVELPRPDGEVIPPGGELEIPRVFEGGCAKMFVWRVTPRHEMLWCGLTPLAGGNNHPVLIDPDSKKVLHDGREIPSCPMIEKFGRDTPVPLAPEGGFSLWWVVLLIIVLLIILWFWR